MLGIKSTTFLGIEDYNLGGTKTRTHVFLPISSAWHYLWAQSNHLWPKLLNKSTCELSPLPHLIFLVSPLVHMDGRLLLMVQDFVEMDSNGALGQAPQPRFGMTNSCQWYSPGKYPRASLLRGGNLHISNIFKNGCWDLGRLSFSLPCHLFGSIITTATPTCPHSKISFSGTLIIHGQFLVKSVLSSLNPTLPWASFLNEKFFLDLEN